MAQTGYALEAQFCKTDEWGDNCRNQVDGFDLQSNQAVTPKLPRNGYKVRQFNNIIEIRHLTVGKCDSINKATLLINMQKHQNKTRKE